MRSIALTGKIRYFGAGPNNWEIVCGTLAAVKLGVMMMNKKSPLLLPHLSSLISHRSL
jgi:hypothetical protein